MTNSKKNASRLPGDDLVSDKDLREETKNRFTGIKGNDILLRLIEAGKAPDVLDPRLLPKADNGETPLASRYDVALRNYELPRDDDLTLGFQGYLIGWNEIDPNVPCGTSVSIFITRRDKIITFVHQWQRDDRRDRTSNRAGVHTTADQALAWLKEDGRGYLGRSSREAWERACQAWPPLQGRDVEHVE